MPRIQHRVFVCMYVNIRIYADLIVEDVKENKQDMLYCLYGEVE